LTGQATHTKGVVAEVSLFFAAVFVGMDFVAVKYALEGIPPLVLVPIRYVLAGLMLLGLLRFSGRKMGIGRRDLPTMFGLGLVGVALNQVGYTAGLGLTSGSNGALIFATAPIWGLLLGVALRLERASWQNTLGLGLAVTGVALVVGGGLGSPEASIAGDLLVCLSALSWGAYAVLSLPILRRHDPLLVAGWTMLLGGAAVVPFGLTGLPGLSDPLGSVDWGSVGPVSWAAVIYSTLFASGFAIAAWQANVSRIGANKVLVYMYVVTLVGLAASVALLGEGLGRGKLAGAGVILLGVYLARRA
jgi:drug/metabolite transporter (DMT)-like permease